MTDVKINVRAVHFDAQEKLIQHIEKRIQKLVKLSDQIIESEVFLKLENASEQENKTVEIRLVIPGYDLFAKKTAKSFEEACDSAIEALRRQLKKRKEKVWGV